MRPTRLQLGARRKVRQAQAGEENVHEHVSHCQVPPAPLLRQEALQEAKRARTHLPLWAPAPGAGVQPRALRHGSREAQQRPQALMAGVLGATAVSSYEGPYLRSKNASTALLAPFDDAARLQRSMKPRCAATSSQTSSGITSFLVIIWNHLVFGQQLRRASACRRQRARAARS